MSTISKLLATFKSGQTSEEEQLMAAARAAYKENNLEQSLILCQQVLELAPTFNEAHMLAAKAMMPGNDYLNAMAKIHQKIKPEGYLEIGVATGKSMALADTETRVIGIDPAFKINTSITAKARLFPTTSDNFFANNSVAAELDNKPMDLAFIDGLHLFEQVLKDFINVEKNSHSKTTVLIHDCFPATALSAERERHTAYWAGDVWKIIPCLLKERPDLAIKIIPAFPSGLAIVTNLDNTSTRLASDLEQVSKRYSDMAFNQNNFNQVVDKLLIENRWDAIEPLIAQR